MLFSFILPETTHSLLKHEQVDFISLLQPADHNIFQRSIHFPINRKAPHPVEEFLQRRGRWLQQTKGTCLIMSRDSPQTLINSLRPPPLPRHLDQKPRKLPPREQSPLKN